MSDKGLAVTSIQLNDARTHWNIQNFFTQKAYREFLALPEAIDGVFLSCPPYTRPLKNN